MTSKMQQHEATQVGSGQKLLVDSMPVQLQLVEAGEGGKLKVRGEFARVDRPTENNRRYTRELMEREVGRLQKDLGERKVLGELDHPADGRTQLQRVSHLITSLNFDGDLLIGEAEPVDTDRGRNLKALLQSGVRIGVSSRGYGSTKANGKGEEVVQDDYKLVTFDFVAEPADSTAYPDVVYEEKQLMADLMNVTVEQLKEANPSLVEQISQEREQELAKKWAEQLSGERVQAEQQVRTDLKEEFTRELVSTVAKMKGEVREQVRGEMLADPALAGARSAIAVVKEALRPFVLPEDAAVVVKAKDEEITKLRRDIAERDLRLKGLETDLVKLEGVAREAGYKYYVEQQVAGNPDAPLIRRLVGDVRQFRSAAQIKTKIEAVQGEMKKQREIEEANKRKMQRESAIVEGEQKKLREQVEKATSALEASLQMNKELGIRLYAEQRLQGHPQSTRVRALIESMTPQSQGEVDAIFENFRAPIRQQEALDETRARVRSLTRGPENAPVTTEEAPRVRASESTNFNGLGVSLTELRGLSGIHDRK